MKLALDIGNTQIKLGIFEHLKLIHTECFQHNDNQNINLNYIKKFKPTVSIISSVVPNLTDTYVKNIYNILGLDSLIVNDENCHIDLKVPEPNTVGADRICNVVATIKIYNKPAIVIDFGTATTYDVINKNGQFIGGIIAPGIKTSSQYLIEKAALLDYVDFEFPKKVIGKNTEDNIKISNLTLYDFILAKFGYSVDISSEETNYLFYGNINQRFGNELKYMQAN